MEGGERQTGLSLRGSVGGWRMLGAGYGPGRVRRAVGGRR